MIDITTNNGAFLVEFDDNVLYLQDGTMGMPMSSMIVLSDESDIITFRRVGNNDVLFSAKYDEITLDGETFDTKEDAVEALGEALNQPTGGGGDPEKEVASIAITGNGTGISLLNENDDVIASANTSVWLADKYVKSATTSGSTLILVIDTESGDTEVRVDLGDMLDDYTLQSDFEEASEVTANALTSLRNTKQNNLTAGSNIEISSGDVISSNQVIVLTQAEYDALVDPDPNKLYIISDATPFDPSSYVTSGWVETQLETKQDELVAGSGITISGNVISADGGDLSNYYTKDEIDNAEQATSAALNDLNYRLNNIDLSDYYTKAEIDAMIGYINDALETINGNTNP